eukprot:m.23667 g.23667  ORF g.23667 m.23667 type:complete len:192 (-) comp9016_c0_seq1:171-746(-)
MQQQQRQKQQQQKESATLPPSTSETISRGTIDEAPRDVLLKYDPQPDWPVIHQSLPSYTMDLLDMIKRTPKVLARIHRKDENISIGCNLNNMRLPDQNDDDEFEFIFVSKVGDNSLAHSCGIRVGDIVYRVNNLTYNHTYEEVAKEIKNSKDIVFLLARPSMLLDTRELPDEHHSWDATGDHTEEDYFSDE